MFEGNWKCSNCGTSITELPFEPRGTQNLLCRDCHAKRRAGSAGSNRGERVMYEGNWTCSNCGNRITKLPFQPRETGNLRCLDCFKKERAV